MRFFYFIAQIILKSIFSVFYGLKVMGPVEETRDRPVLFASDHQSFVDPLIIGSIIRQEIYYFAKEEIFEWFIIKDLAAFFNAFPIKRGSFDPKAIRIAKRVLGSGRSLMMFPEGTRSKTGALQKAKSGVGMLAVRNKVDIIPVCIYGTFKLRRSFLKYPGIIVSFGRRIPIREYLDRTGPRKELYQEIGDRIMDEIANLWDKSIAYSVPLRHTK